MGKIVKYRFFPLFKSFFTNPVYTSFGKRYLPSHHSFLGDIASFRIYLHIFTPESNTIRNFLLAQVGRQVCAPRCARVKPLRDHSSSKTSTHLPKPTDSTLYSTAHARLSNSTDEERLTTLKSSTTAFCLTAYAPTTSDLNIRSRTPQRRP